MKSLKVLMAESIAVDLDKLISRMTEYEKMQPTPAIKDNIVKLNKIRNRMDV